MHIQPAMKLRTLFATALMCSAAFVFTACGSGGTSVASLPGAGGGGPNDGTPQVLDSTVDFSMAAGMTEIAPNFIDTVSPSVDLGRFGISGFDRVYEVTTPAGDDFAFQLVARNPGNSGDTLISIGHGAIDGVSPNGGPETIAGEGMVVEGPGLGADGTWIQSNGDGFSRVSVSGNINRDQVLVARVPQPEGDDEVIAICVSIGDESEINQDDIVVNDANTTVDEVIFSSDAYQFGLPAIAVSGDRYSIATYDGDSNDPWAYERKRRWLQYDPNTQTTTGGEAQDTSRDGGNWRNQEIAGQENVLAVVTTGHGGVQVDVSLDRGASFSINESFSSDGISWGQRLCNIDIADDYTIGLIFWRTTGDDFDSIQTELMLVEGMPTGFDGNGTPLGYVFSAGEVVHQPSMGDSTPLLMQLEYSSASDLVIGYGYTQVEFTPNMPTSTSTASFRCATRKAGEAAFNDLLVDFEDGVIPNDPSVALLGSGANMQVFFAYEKSDGVHLAHSSDCGETFTAVTNVGNAGAFQPSIHVRDQGGMTRVDLLFLNPTTKGLELHDLRWDDFNADGSGSVQEALTEATRTQVEDQTGSNQFMPFAPTVEIHDVAWFGYDAVTKGDDVAIVVHEHDRTSFDFMNAPGRGTPGILPVFFGGGLFGGFDQAGGAGAANTPVVLSPGLIGPVAAPTAAHRNQLRLLVID